MGFEQPGERAEERGLAGAVRADQSGDAPILDHEIDVLDAEAVPVAGREVARFEPHARHRTMYSRNGAPAMAVTMPSGISTGLSTIRASKSA